MYHSILTATFILSLLIILYHSRSLLPHSLTSRLPASLQPSPPSASLPYATCPPSSSLFSRLFISLSPTTHRYMPVPGFDWYSNTANGLSSTLFDISANIADGDSCSGLDPSGAQDIQTIMQTQSVSFDQARLIRHKQILVKNNIDPQTGLPLDKKKSFSPLFNISLPWAGDDEKDGASRSKGLSRYTEAQRKGSSAGAQSASKREGAAQTASKPPSGGGADGSNQADPSTNGDKDERRSFAAKLIPSSDAALRPLRRSENYLDLLPDDRKDEPPELVFAIHVDSDAVHPESGRYGCLAAENVYNCFNPNDPVAFQLAPTVDSGYAKLVKPISIENATEALLHSLALPRISVSRIFEKYKDHPFQGVCKIIRQAKILENDRGALPADLSRDEKEQRGDSDGDEAEGEEEEDDDDAEDDDDGDDDAE
ncbi:uncharacterized protein UBRO2_03734 [Ustilago bromivora]|uniref:DDHD domain-containing protein n=1 Tax=Ustilago bromivora TaxID=307758 RepID=A0A8H8TT79_9BASI|nr:uncharacterized protein UBRO2_03734 [Ustilago bromivora]